MCVCACCAYYYVCIGRCVGVYGRIFGGVCICMCAYAHVQVIPYTSSSPLLSLSSSSTLLRGRKGLPLVLSTCSAACLSCNSSSRDKFIAAYNNNNNNNNENNGSNNSNNNNNNNYSYDRYRRAKMASRFAKVFIY